MLISLTLPRLCDYEYSLPSACSWNQSSQQQRTLRSQALNPVLDPVHDRVQRRSSSLLLLDCHGRIFSGALLLLRETSTINDVLHHRCKLFSGALNIRLRDLDAELDSHCYNYGSMNRRAKLWVRARTSTRRRLSHNTGCYIPTLICHSLFTIAYAYKCIGAYVSFAHRRPSALTDQAYAFTRP